MSQGRCTRRPSAPHVSKAERVETRSSTPYVAPSVCVDFSWQSARCWTQASPCEVGARVSSLSLLASIICKSHTLMSPSAPPETKCPRARDVVLGAMANDVSVPLCPGIVTSGAHEVQQMATMSPLIPPDRSSPLQGTANNAEQPPSCTDIDAKHERVAGRNMSQIRTFPHRCLTDCIPPVANSEDPAPVQKF